MPATGNEIIFVLFSMMIGLTFFALLLNQITVLGGVLAGETTSESSNAQPSPRGRSDAARCCR